MSLETAMITMIRNAGAKKEIAENQELEALLIHEYFVMDKTTDPDDLVSFGHWEYGKPTFADEENDRMSFTSPLMAKETAKKLNEMLPGKNFMVYYVGFTKDGILGFKRVTNQFIATYQKVNKNAGINEEGLE